MCSFFFKETQHNGRTMAFDHKEKDKCETRDFRPANLSHWKCPTLYICGPKVIRYTISHIEYFDIKKEEHIEHLFHFKRHVNLIVLW